MGPAPASRQPWLAPRVGAALACAVAGVALFQVLGNANQGYIATRSLFWWWSYQWINPASETEHGWVILGLSGWLLWRNLRRSPAGITAPGDGERRVADAAVTPGLALAGAVALHVVGFVAQQARVSILALVLFTWGVLRLGGGRRWGRAAAFPLAFLAFAIPFNVLDTLGFWLRLWVTDASAALAHGFHLAVVQTGTQLVAPDGRYHYDVAAACSGVRSLMALTALALLIGYLEFRTLWRRGVIVLLCFPLVYLGNVLRILAIVGAAQAGGTRWGDVAHEVMGYLIFAIVLGGAFGAARLLARFAPEAPASPAADAAADASPPRWFAPATVATVGAAMVFLAHVAQLSGRGSAGVMLSRDGRDPAELPMLLGADWVGTPAAVTAVERQVLPPDTGYSRMNYAATHDRRQVFLSIVLSGRDRTSIHRPEVCLVGQGWTIAGRTTRRFAYPGRQDADFPATVLRVERQDLPGRTAAAPQIVAYWFVGGDCVVANHWRRLAIDAWNRVVHGRADRWAYVLVQTAASDGEEAALRRIQAVLDATLPCFQPPVPLPANARFPSGKKT